MTVVDLWAAGAAAVAACALATRANMLKPRLAKWSPAPWPVWGGLMALSISLGMGVVTILNGHHAGPREAVVYSVLALVALVMVVNLHINGREASTVRRRQGVRLVTTFEVRDPASIQTLARAAARKRGRS